MFIEYKISFEGGVVTISQRVEPGAETQSPATPAPEEVAPGQSRVLGAAFSRAGSGPSQSIGVGAGPSQSIGVGAGPSQSIGVGAGPSSVPIVILGPIVIGGTGQRVIRSDAPTET